VTLYVVAQIQGDEIMLVATDGGVAAFESAHAAEDFSDQLDVPGEFCVIPYEESMGPYIVIV